MRHLKSDSDDMKIVTRYKSFKLAHNESLLDGLLRTGHQIEYQCRNGYCGACRCKLISGKVSYPTPPLAFVSDNEVLACCCKPESTLELDVERVATEQKTEQTA